MGRDGFRLAAPTMLVVVVSRTRRLDNAAGQGADNNDRRESFQKTAHCSLHSLLGKQRDALSLRCSITVVGCRRNVMPERDPKDQLKFAVFMSGESNYHLAGWRLPESYADAGIRL